ncbi:MAG: hypothetical protein LBG46_03150 [Elusimicrobiota bacterium]|jgi:predicted Zn-ribbon and HTH transcriptional regulator|nr:hypothetical protein [Elusimicrobiota bacterium]
MNNLSNLIFRALSGRGLPPENINEEVFNKEETMAHVPEELQEITKCPQCGGTDLSRDIGACMDCGHQFDDEAPYVMADGEKVRRCKCGGAMIYSHTDDVNDHICVCNMCGSKD